MSRRRLAVCFAAIGAVATIAGAAASTPFHGVAAIAAWVLAALAVAFWAGLLLDRITGKDGSR